MRYPLRPEFDLVLIVFPGRAEKCGYRSTKDCMHELTALCIRKFVDAVLIEGNHVPGVFEIRNAAVDGKMLYAMWGLPKDIADHLGVDIMVPAGNLDKVSLFIVGACWIDSPVRPSTKKGR